MTIERDAYAVLQVDPKADPIVIRAAYRALARLCHPDGSAPDATQMAELNCAHDLVKTPEARRQYDRAHPQLMAVGPGRDAPIYDAWPDSRDALPAPGDPASVLDFGRYAGWKVSDVARVDPDHLRWLSRHSTGIRFREAIARCLPGDRELGRRSSVLG